MPSFESPHLRSLKGAPLSVFLCLWLSGSAYLKHQLEIRTKYSDKPVSEALAVLSEDYGWVEQDRETGRWQIAAGAPALPEQAGSIFANLDIRALKGAPLAVLACLLLIDRVANQERIERLTGYTDKPVSQALAYLQELGLLVHTREGWALAAPAVQLPFIIEASRNNSDSVSLETGGAVEVLPARVGNIPSRSEAVVVDGFESGLKTGVESLGVGIFPTRNFSDSLSDSSSGSRFKDLNNLINSTTTTKEAGESEKFRVNLEALWAFGIGGPADRELARLDHVTPRLIRYHCTTSENTGQAIWRIRNAWPVPARWCDPEEPAGDLLEPPTLPEPDPEPEIDLTLLYTPPADLDQAWQAVLGQLRMSMGERSTEFARYAKTVLPLEYTPGQVSLGVPDENTRAWDQSRLARICENLLSPMLGEKVSITFVVDPRRRK